jgi:hypothetical protein
MTQKQAIIKAITNFDVDMLDVILDQDSYMNVPKELFLKTLRQKFYYLKTEGSDKFIKVIPGNCNKCFKGRGGYTFLTANQRTLDLLFTEEDGHVTDLFVCSDFNTDEVLEKDSIYFYFKDDEQINYNPSEDVRNFQNRIEKILRDFKKLENTIVEIDTFRAWLNEYREINDLVDPFSSYKFVESLHHLYKSISRVYDLVRHHEFAKVAMKHYKSIDLTNKSQVIDWLLQYEDSDLCWYDDFTITENWQETNFILLKNYYYEENVAINNYDNIIIDVSPYRIALAFTMQYSTLHQDYMNKYNPTDEMYDKYGGFSGGLSDYLFAWGAFPDLLKKHNFKDLEIAIND